MEVDEADNKEEETKMETGTDTARKRASEMEINERKAAKFIKTLDREEKKRRREGNQDDERVGVVSERDESRGDGKRQCPTQSSATGGDWTVNGYVVNEEVMEVDAGEDVEEEWRSEAGEEDEDELDPKMVEEGRREEVEFMVGKLDMFEFGTLEEARRRGGKTPTTTKWV